MKEVLHSNRRHLLLRSIGWGIGTGVSIAALLLLVSYFSGKPRQWDARSFIAHDARLFAMAPIHENDNGSGIGYVLQFNVENTTTTDFTLPADLTVMDEDGKTKALSTSSFVHRSTDFLPAHHITEVSLSTGTLCDFNETEAIKDDKKIHDCFNSRLNKIDQIIVFDQVSKYELHIERPRSIETIWDE